MTLNRNAPKTRFVQLLDLVGYTSKKDGTLWHMEQEVPRGEMCYYATPYDCPAYVRFWRRLNVQKPGDKATVVEDLGVTAEIDAYTFGVKVYLKFDRPTKKGEGALSEASCQLEGSSDDLIVTNRTLASVGSLR